tara:strand:+ start:429 stop:731 length:303 start_codon:yes stop_codon:yes gene_type:complete
MSLQKRLQKILEEKGMNASSFANSIDVKKSNLSHIISGRNKPSTDFFLKIKKTYPEIDLNWLITGKRIKKDINFTKPDDNNIESIVVFFNDGSYKRFAQQ